MRTASMLAELFNTSSMRVIHLGILCCLTIDMHGSTLAQINQAVSDDPALPHQNKPCPKCQTEDAVYFQAQSNRDLSNMQLFFVCCGCGHKWQDDVE
eukprot:m.22849 g.22849  ORF g.22849 m.22849 type:complete len:97 (-) comp11298_c0_seq6:1786-2076(-)